MAIRKTDKPAPDKLALEQLSSIKLLLEILVLEQTALAKSRDGDIWLSSFSETRKLLETQFRDCGHLGDGPAQISGIAPFRRANSWLGLCEELVRQVSDVEIRHRLSISIKSLVDEVVKAASIGKIADMVVRESVTEQNVRRSTGANASKQQKNSSRDGILDESIKAVVRQAYGAKITSRQVRDIRKLVHERLKVSDIKGKEVWPSSSVVRRRAQRLLAD